MIVNYAPAIARFSKDQREPSMRIIAFTFQFPMAHHDYGFRICNIQQQIVENERTHLGARVVSAFIVIQHRLPAMRYFVT